MTLPTASGARRVGVQPLASFAADALTAAGLPGAQAATVAQAMVEADLTGADAHGILRLPQYVAALRRGDINPRPQLQLHGSGPSTAIVDGDNGMGHVVMAAAVAAAIERARQTGIAWVGTRRSNHAGAGGVYAAMPAHAGMVGVYSAVSGLNHMAASGGATPLLGTNPLAIALPARDGAPVVIDIAMSVVSSGVVRAHALTGQPMPAGWMTDRVSGEPLHDAKDAAKGLIEPIGGYKGAGLALVLGLLAGTLNGAAFGADLPDFATPDSGFGVNTGQFILALDVARFMPLDAFMQAVERHLHELEASPRLPGSDAIRWPGRERERRRAERLAHGVALPAELWSQLDGLATQLGVAALASR